MEQTIGETAGLIWNYLDSHGETEVTKIKFDLNLNNTTLFLSLGWLLRENKIQLQKEKNTSRAKLIQQI